MKPLNRFVFWIGSFSGAVDGNEIKSALDDVAGTNAKLKLLWIVCGENDRFLERNHQFIAQAQSLRREPRMA